MAWVLAIDQKEVLWKFDRTKPKLSVLKEDATEAEKKKDAKELTSWQKEILGKYLLTQKLPDSMFTKCFHKGSVATIWLAIVKEFTKRGMLMGVKSPFRIYVYAI